jgi:dienelactone hydrolase
MRCAATLFTMTLATALAAPAASASPPPPIPWDMEALLSAPPWQETAVVKPLGAQTWGYAGNLNTPELRAADETNGKVKAVFYDGPPYQGKPTKVFAWIGIPKPEPGRRLPGMVLVHGGGGTAYESWVRLWNARGYAAIAMDTVGNIQGLGRNPEGGPGNCGDFAETDKPVPDQWTYHAVSAVILAHSLLRSLPEVDPARIGITGVSWGGFLTCIAAGLDHRFKCVIPIYGCGYLTAASAWIDRINEQGDKGKAWCALWDPSVYLPKVEAPIYWLAGTNDAAYWMTALNQSARLIRGQHSLSILGDMPHGHGGPGEAPLEIGAIAAHYLKDGPALPEFGRLRLQGKTLSVTCSYGQELKEFTLHYTSASPVDPKALWLTLPIPDVSKGRARCQLPPGTTMAFINAMTTDGLRFSSDILDLSAP